MRSLYIAAVLSVVTAFATGAVGSSSPGKNTIRCSSNEITIRFVEPKTGEPLRKMWVGLTQYKDHPPKGPIPAKFVLATSQRQTDANGKVAFCLHEPIPTYLAVHSFDLSNNGSLLSVEEVMNRGVVLDFSKRSAAGTLPKPGIILFVERRISTLDRMRQELP